MTLFYWEETRDVGARGHWDTCPPPIFCNKQRSSLFILRNCPFCLRKSTLEVSCPQSLRCFLHPWKKLLQKETTSTERKARDVGSMLIQMFHQSIKPCPHLVLIENLIFFCSDFIHHHHHHHEHAGHYWSSDGRPPLCTPVGISLVRLLQTSTPFAIQ